MKTLEKALVILFAAVFVFVLAACSYEAGYPQEVPEEPAQPQAWNSSKSNTPAAPDVGGLEIPVDDNTSSSGDEYKVVYLGVELTSLTEAEFAEYSFLVPGDDYTIDTETKTITLTASGYQKVASSVI